MGDVLIPTLLFLVMVGFHVLRSREVYSEATFELGAASTLGTREVQQDYFGTKKIHSTLLMLLADGIGENGDSAAKLAVDTFRDLFNDNGATEKPQYFFKRAANATNKKIVNTLEERQGETSIAAVIVEDSRFFYMLVGNSRIAVFRDGDLIPVSQGQTVDVLARHRYDEGKISKRDTLALLSEHRRYNVLGQDSFQEIEIFDKPIELQRDDLVVLMSEGVFNTLNWTEIEQALENKTSAKDAASDVISCVNRSPRVDKDNASILVYRQE